MVHRCLCLMYRLSPRAVMRRNRCPSVSSDRLSHSPTIWRVSSQRYRCSPVPSWSVFENRTRTILSWRSEIRSSVTSEIRNNASLITRSIAEFRSTAERTVCLLNSTDPLYFTPRQSVALPTPSISTLSANTRHCCIGDR